MKNKKPLLSICIPTWNREKCLIDCINSIVNQKWFNNDEIEIVISDNWSIDKTSSVCSWFISQWYNIKYSNNWVNMWFDRNLLKVVDMAHGKYCMILADDDTINNNWIFIILNFIKNNDIDYIMLNFRTYDKDLKEPVDDVNYMSINKNTYYSSLKEFIHNRKWNNYRLSSFFTFMSEHLFKKEIWDEFPLKDSFIWTQVIHLHVLLSCMKNKSFAMISYPVVKNRSYNRRPNYQIDEIYTNKKAIKTNIWIAKQYGLKMSYYKTFFHFSKQALLSKIVVYINLLFGYKIYSYLKRRLKKIILKLM